MRTTDERYSDTVARLASAQKSSRGAPLYSRLVNRRLGRYLAALAYRTPLTPNGITAISAACTFAGIAVLACLRASVLVGIVVCVLLVLGYAFDSADGQLARLRGGGSTQGEWLDHVVDCIKCTGLHLAVGIAWFRYFDFPDVSLLIPVGFTLESSVFFFAVILSEQLRKASPRRVVPAASVAQEAAPMLRSVLVLPADYGLLCVVFLLLGWHLLFAWVYGVLLLLNIGIALAALRRWFGEMATL